MKSLKEIKDQLHEAIKQSKQTSYQRRLPEPASLKKFIQLCSDLEDFVEKQPQDKEAYRLLALTHEAMLNYSKAAQALETSITLSEQSEKKYQKRLVLYRQQQSWWSILNLSPQQLKHLGNFLNDALANEKCQQRSLKWTKQWLEKAHHPEPQKVIQGLGIHGALTDFQVLHNIVYG